MMIEIALIVVNASVMVLAVLAIEVVVTIDS